MKFSFKIMLIGLAVVTANTASALEFILPNATTASGFTTDIVMEIDNPDHEVVAFNCDLTFPEGITPITDSRGDIICGMVADRKDGHDFQSSTLDGSYRFVCYSGKNYPLIGTSGPVFTVSVDVNAAPGTYDIKVSNCVITYPEGDTFGQYLQPDFTSQLVVTEPEVIRYGENQLYAKDLTIQQGENATLVICYNSTSDVFEYRADITLPEGVGVSAVSYEPVVADVANYTNEWSVDGFTLKLNGEYGGGRRDVPAEGGNKIIALATLNTAALAPGVYTISVANQYLSNDDDDFSPEAYEARLTVVGEAPAVIALMDGTPYENNEEKSGVTVTYTRTFASTGWQALYLPFEMNVSDWSAYGDVAELNNIHQYDTDDDGVLDKTTIEFNRVTSGSLRANTPYVFKANTTEEITFTCEDCTLYAAPLTDPYIECSTTKQIYRLYGTYTVKEGLRTQGAYALSAKGQFVKAKNDTQTLDPYRIYLLVTEKGYGATSRAPERIDITVDGETSSIEDIEFITEGDDMYYDILGRPVTTPQSGIYINNGKKVYIK